MAFIRPADQDKLRARFERELQHDVRLILFVEPPTGLFIPGREESQTARPTQQLLEEVTSLSPKLLLEVHDPRTAPELAARYQVQRTPAIVLMPAMESTVDGPGSAAGPNGAGPAGGLVRFFGMPAGYEFMALIDDIVDVSRSQTRLSDTTREALAALPGPVHLQVFVTPT